MYHTLIGLFIVLGFLGGCCKGNCNCCHTETETAHKACYYTQTRLATPSADPIALGTRQGPTKAPILKSLVRLHRKKRCSIPKSPHPRRTPHRQAIEALTALHRKPTRSQDWGKSARHTETRDGKSHNKASRPTVQRTNGEGLAGVTEVT